MNTSYEEIDFLNKISFYIRTYVYATTGLLLSVINIPSYYCILSFVFIHGGITGLLSLCYAIRIFSKPYLLNVAISNKNCIFQISTGLMQMKLLNAFGLLANSIDRLLVVTFPIYYFRSIRKLNTILLIGLYIISFAIALFSIIITQLSPDKMTGSNCAHQKVLHPTALFLVQLFSTSSALMSVIVMMCVVHCNKRHFDRFINNAQSVGRDLQNFLKKQKEFTLTALISCIITLFLHVTPSLIQTICSKMDYQICLHVGLYCNLLSYLNSFNMPLLFLYRQGDVREKISNLICCRLTIRTPVNRITSNNNKITSTKQFI
uniref:G-protein coupled receptors family 1 profile domain-containing protein n=1 Tax=Wuchereria bancrofti TaxID=6293 RepID=A0AAF5PZ10_WUCBA